jgi:isoquinoline 1-oxidoreductase beta subunit
MNRRGFLQVGASATAGFLAGFYLPERSKLFAQEIGDAAPKLNAWIHIAPDDTVTFMIHKVEMGQGTLTSLSQLLADELDCDWGKFRTEFPPVDPAFGFQGVVGSQSIRTSYTPLRKAGAAARDMLVEAAAQNWNVDKSKCRTEHGFVVNTASNDQSVTENWPPLPRNFLCRKIRRSRIPKTSSSSASPSRASTRSTR